MFIENSLLLLTFCRLGSNEHLLEILLMAILFVLLIALLVTRIFGRKDGSGNAAYEKAEQEIEELKNEIKSLKEDKKKNFKNGALYSLILLQREGRFVDFVMDNIGNCDDSQLAAVARQVHSGCAKLVHEKFKVSSLIRDKAEGENITLNNEFNPEEISLTGNVPSSGPYNGILRHKGWISGEVELPEMINKNNFSVIYQAEVESL